MFIVSLYSWQPFKMNWSNQMRQPQKFNRKLHWEITAKCFRCGNLHNLKLCPFINKECFYFAKIRNTLQKFAEKTQVIINHQAFFQCNFRNYPGWEFREWFVFNILVTYFKYHTTNYHIYYHCRSQFAYIDRHWSIDYFIDHRLVYWIGKYFKR